MDEFILFLGRFHVLALHLPIGIVILAVALDWLVRAPKRQTLAAAVPFIWAAAALSAVLTVVLGYMHFSEGGFTGPSATAHRLFGTLLGIACVAAWFVSAKLPVLYKKINVPTGIALLALVTVTGHYGGNLTHGAEYLVEYAPDPLRALAGMPERRARVLDAAAADPWHDVVQPILESRCANCHNESKRNGDLSVIDYESLMRGGETGRVIAVGAAGASELYRRITLPADDDAFMPAEGKTPLTTGQLGIVRWWIDAGAPIDTTAAAIGVPEEIEALLRAELGLDVVEATNDPVQDEIDSDALDALFSEGYLVRRVSQVESALMVSIHSVGTQLDMDALNALYSSAPSIVSLDLSSAGLDDEAIAGFDAFNALRNLRLNNNELTDSAMGTLAGLRSIESLNLYGNDGITDASVELLATMPALTDVYLWQTSVTTEGIDQLRSLRPGLHVQGAAAEGFTTFNPDAVDE